MVYLTSTLHLLALALIANVAHALPTHPKCDTPTYGPFNLYAVTEERVSVIKVVNNGTDLDGNTISTLSTCDTCGKKPLYWNLKDSVLSPVFTTTGHGDPSVETINLDLFIGQVELITGPKKNLTPAPIFCAESPITDHPTTLSANGDSNLFSVCASQIWYNLGKPTTSVPDCQDIVLYINEYNP